MRETMFWMVWSPQGSAPTVRHETEESAMQEAQRLARINPGREFYVLLATTKYVKADVQCIALDTPEVPF